MIETARSIFPHIVNGIAGSISAIIFIWIAVWVRKPIKRIVSNINITASGYIAALAQILVFSIGTLVTISVSGIQTAVILTIIAILSAGLALALDWTIKDLISSGKILLFNYFKVGDLITVEEYTGIVLDINSFNTVLRTESYEHILIANHAILESKIINHTAAGVYELCVKIPIEQDHDTNSITIAMLERAKTISGIDQVNIIHAWVIAGDSYIQEYSVNVPIVDFSDRRDLASDISAGITYMLRDIL